ncbi:MAG: 4a-hydroxytetrahydrobiopterin dehydratase [Actinomycetota bacterium]|nr:4a-hydroxytetrahydrobiopterin dehydratase [Actinomycetota bacterium]
MSYPSTMAGMTEDQIREALAELPGWRYERGEIFKQYKFPSFLDAIAFIDRLADAAEEANHHPDLENHYNRVRVALHTWSEDGVTEKDIALAHRIEAIEEPAGF